MCFRLLKASEIDVRVQQIYKAGEKVKARLLLYKDARVDMMLLDEHFGVLGWQREHTFIDGKNYCTVSVRNDQTGEWIKKQDVGVESMTEKTKGESSDAFKRACTCLGIGRELYSAGNITVELTIGEYYTKKDTRGNEALALSNFVHFRVGEIDYDTQTRTIEAIKIVDHNGKTRYTRGTAHDPIHQACAEMNAATSLKQCQAVWSKYNEYQTEVRFITAKEAMKEKLKTQQ